MPSIRTELKAYVDIQFGILTNLLYTLLNIDIGLKITLRDRNITNNFHAVSTFSNFRSYNFNYAPHSVRMSDVNKHVYGKLHHERRFGIKCAAKGQMETVPPRKI